MSGTDEVIMTDDESEVLRAARPDLDGSVRGRVRVLWDGGDQVRWEVRGAP